MINIGQYEGDDDGVRNKWEGVEPATLLYYAEARCRAAPISVAILPKIMSNSMHPVRVLLIMQPKNNPGMAAGVNTGRMVRGF